jgi:hypothetical protein
MHWQGLGEGKHLIVRDWLKISTLKPLSSFSIVIGE